ncbi:CMGC/CDK/CRK7 protein kinase [Fusarium austroafricanum]|uniref:cyclin-dependent kinase n=1 Tax=Fusarium austroafricanum TaxID=2364996 RepID=A0A8H4K9A9_9HYPO|nr:CMGC/CDK/CRK7 protein kinase [Fusarium austroafricanum]
MENVSKPPPRRRHAAMRDDQERDDQGERARDERGVKPSQRSRSPRQVRDSRRASDTRRERPSARPDSRSSRRRRHSRDRSRDRAARPLPEPSRRGPEVEDLIPRYRERHREIEEKSRRRSQSRSPSRDLFSRASLSASKRHRSRSPSLTSSNRKGSRRNRSPRPRTRDYSPESAPRKHVRHPSRDLRKSSPRRQGRSKSPGRSRHRSLSKSDSGPRPADREIRSQIDRSQPRSRSRSPTSEHQSSSSRRAHPSSIEDQRASGLDQLSSRRQPPPRSPHVGRERRSREGSPGWRHSSRSDIDEDMTSRSHPRGGYSQKFSQKPHMSNDSYSQSPQHVSYHNSPSRSPYGSSRGGWNGQQSYAPHHPQGSNHGPPSGPSNHYHSNPTRSSPHSAPTGPMQQYPQGGSYRGGYRGGGFRGRGRGGFKNSHWNQGPPPRGHPDDLSNERFSNVDEPRNAAFDPMDVEEESFQPHDQLGEESNRGVEDEADPLTTLNRPPPSGPGGSSGSKFSFAFKPSSKPAVTAPKPEISQKLNAAPRREPPTDSRDRDRARDRVRDRDREPPRSAPTEPASSRPRHDRRQPPEGPRVAPRMRKVKKIMKRPKPRPTLPADLVDSESVFFRKPGNESVVGSGTYGKVFKGLNVYTKGMVALKRIRMEGERDGFPVTAIREIKLLQSLRHINIVNLQEVMVEKNDCFMVFEYLSHDLTGLLNHPTFKLEAAQKKDLAKQMFEGLDYLHTRGVLHRDIKAANILVSNEGVLKIADFGLARFYAKRHQLDYTNRVITIWYRSPELLLGETKYTAAVDVWSAACVMVEIFDRNAIFPGDGTELSQLEKIYNVMGTPNLKHWPGLVDMSWFELLRPTVKKRNIFAEKYRDKMSPAAFDLLSAMLHYDPAKRPSAAQVLQHPYFTEEAPPARQATELSTHNDWHEFESKALRKENDRREREARKLAKENASRDKEKDKKRVNEGTDQRDAKRLQVDKNGGNKPTSTVVSSKPTTEA